MRRGKPLVGSLTALTVSAALGLARVPLLAQPVVPPAASAQFQSVVGDRIEAISILAGDYAAAGRISRFAAARWRT